MSLQWVTPAGLVANLLIGVPVAIQLKSVDLSNQGIGPVYSISGTDTLPPGLSLSSTGLISGTPEYSTSSNNYFTEISYNFTVRLIGSDGSQPVDEQQKIQPYRTFRIIIVNIVNNHFNWITPAGSLGTMPNGEFYSLQLQAETTGNVAITYSFLSGELPPGMEMLPSGHLQGVPTFLNPIAVAQSKTYRFSIRATTATGHINDQSFSLTLTNIYAPIITPNSPLDRVYDKTTMRSVLANYPPGMVTLGSVFDGTYYSEQLNVFELNPNVQIEWKIKEGNLPLGLTLSSTGLISGYIQPLLLNGDFGPPGYDGEYIVDGTVITQEEFGSAPYDFIQLSQTLNYTFTVQAYDGANYSLQTYIIEVVSRSDYTADNANVSVNNTQLTVDGTNIYPPILLNTPGKLPEGRQDSYYAYKFNGIDFGGAEVFYAIGNIYGAFDSTITGVDNGLDFNGDDETHTTGVGFDGYDPKLFGANIPGLGGLQLDPVTGWLYGKLSPQTVTLQNYEFPIQVYKIVDNIAYYSNLLFFILPVVGDINDTVTWITPKNIGTIDNGSVSDLSLKAVSSHGKQLIYSIYDAAGFPARLPQGLQLKPSGAISGRVSFEAFCLDGYATTFDNNKLTVDRTYTFTAIASIADGTNSSYQEFTLTLNIADRDPYINLYLRASPDLSQRGIYNSIVSNKEIFDPNLIYRDDDPWFGVNYKIDMLFLPGLNSVGLEAYQRAIALNNWNKTFTFGSIKTAVVLDDNYQPKYEVVYVEVVDPVENAQGQGPGLEINLRGLITNPYIDSNDNEFYTIYPNSSQNMIKRLVDNIGYYDQSILPPWMSSNQPSATPGLFEAPLGYTPALVLAYTIPGGSKQIAYRLQTAGINFQNIEFSTDRYYVDNFYSTNFRANAWIGGNETTFDSIPRNNIGTIVASVHYGVTVPFDQINGRPVSYINAAGGIDGVTNFMSGDTLIFIQQENFPDAGPYNGWVRYSDGYIGDNILTNVNVGFGAEEFDAYTVIPGYLESVQNSNVINQRGGVWKINIVDNLVTLIFVQSVLLNQRVQILDGENYKSSIYYYNFGITHGLSVPYYTIFNINLKTKATTFNNSTTKFFSHRDTYHVPGTQDQILKFPQAVAFN